MIRIQVPVPSGVIARNRNRRTRRRSSSSRISESNRVACEHREMSRERDEDRGWLNCFCGREVPFRTAYPANKRGDSWSRTNQLVDAQRVRPEGRESCRRIFVRLLVRCRTTRLYPHTCPEIESNDHLRTFKPTLAPRKLSGRIASAQHAALAFIVIDYSLFIVPSSPCLRVRCELCSGNFDHLRCSQRAVRAEGFEPS